MGRNWTMVKRKICNGVASKIFCELLTNSDFGLVNVCASTPNAHVATDSTVNLL